MSVPTYVHLGTKNPTNSTQTSIPRHIKKMIEFGIDFFGHLVSIWGGAMGCYPLLCFVVSFILRFRGFDPVFAPTWLDFSATGPHLGGLLALIFAFFGAKLAPFWGNWTQERSWMKSNILAWPGGMREAIE